MLFSKKSKGEKAAQVDTDSEALRVQFARVRALAESAGAAADKSREAAVRMSSNSSAEETESKSGSFMARRRAAVGDNNASGVIVNLPDNVIEMDPERNIITVPASIPPALAPFPPLKKTGGTK